MNNGEAHTAHGVHDEPFIWHPGRHQSEMQTIIGGRARISEHRANGTPCWTIPC